MTTQTELFAATDNLHKGDGASPFDRIRRTDDDGAEYWSARELAPVLGYHSWAPFKRVIDATRLVCLDAGTCPLQDFRPTTSPVRIGTGVTRHVINYRITRSGVYLLVIRCNPDHVEVQAFKSYFAEVAYRSHSPEGQGNYDPLRLLSDIYNAHLAACRQIEELHEVYFFLCETTKRIKIGVSHDVESRLKTIRTSAPGKIRCLGSFVVDDPLVEKEVHAMFASSRVSGEWFMQTPELLAFIREKTTKVR
jgi:hypothetical protein